MYIITPHKDLQINSQTHTHTDTHTHTCTNVNISHTNLDCTWNMLEHAQKSLWHKQCRECTGRRNPYCKPVKGVLTAWQSGGLLYIPLLAVGVYTCGFCDLLQVCFSEGWTLLRGNAFNVVPRNLPPGFTFNLKKAEVMSRPCRLAEYTDHDAGEPCMCLKRCLPSRLRIWLLSHMRQCVSAPWHSSKRVGNCKLRYEAHQLHISRKEISSDRTRPIQRRLRATELGDKSISSCSVGGSCPWDNQWHGQSKKSLF